MRTDSGGRGQERKIQKWGPGTGTGTETAGTAIPGTEILGTVPGTENAGTRIPGTQISRGQLSPSPAHL